MGEGRPGGVGQAGDLDRLAAIIRTQYDIATAGLDLDLVQSLVVVRALQLTGAGAAALEWAEGEDLVYRATAGFLEGQVGTRVPMAGSLAGLCLRNGEALCCDEAERDPRVDAAACRALGIRAMAVVPLAAEGARVGVLKVASRHPGAFGEEAVSTLQLLGGLLGAALAQQAAFALNQRLLQERTEHLRALQTSERLFREAFDRAPIGMALIGPNHRFQRVNQALAALLGRSVEELSRMSPLELTRPEDRARVEAEVEAVLQGEHESFQVERRFQRADGRDAWVLTSSVLIRDGSEEPLHFLSHFLDISEHKRMERLKDELVSTVSHELRTPLTSIRGGLGLVASGSLGEVPAPARDMVDLAARNAERLGVLVDDLLDLDRIAQGRMAFDLRPRDPAMLVREALEAGRAYAEPAGVPLELELALAPPLGLISVDAARFLQVMANLLSNAVKFSPAGSPVGVRVRREAAEVRVEVENAGPEIPEAFRQVIFERFAQVDASSTRVQRGSGLGLAISRALVDSMGGDIGFESAAGRTVFWVAFPSV